MNRNKRKQQIMMASLQAFAKSGIQQTNISELVRAAQVSRGTFYLYFSNKEELLYNSLEHFYSQILALVDSLDFTLVKQREDYDAVVQDFASKLTEVIMPFGFSISLFKSLNDLPLNPSCSNFKPMLVDFSKRITILSP